MAHVPDTQGQEISGSRRQLTPHDMWVWNDVNHWKHWHGIWVMWQPLLSPAVNKANRCIRSLRADNEERTRLYHRNQWFPVEDDAKTPGYTWAYGPWIMEEATHSLPNGIWHGDKEDFRILQFENGDLGWLQLELKPDDPNCVVFGEVHFMLPDKNGRAPVILGYDKDKQLGAALMLEETLESDDKPPPAWHGTVWEQPRAMAQLEQSRDPPQGKFIGKETILTTSLVQTQRQAEWNGFTGGVGNQGLDNEYALVHMPYNFTAFAPAKPAIGKEHAFGVSWVMSGDEVRMISWKYGADGKLQHVKSGTYYKVQ
ncbi:hypothetical protein SELMODRAFT_410951 [Selaginella moellendorffii]|uniref:DUF3598 domain-containing protein n=1 Tax=Selaginella moellendorffii TaxID=88036 RepID=D8RHI8_SELML|nr:hypothetical protein SELMODRAFT_418116 [Selaginella moellendorffii]EFJ28288.1 hypothetical protein SELMODRAFT_410951 [Selaginella moellendorffii]